MKLFLKLLKWIGWTLTFFLLLGVITFFSYSNSLVGINPKTIEFYSQLKIELNKQGYNESMIVISAKRAKWHNKLLIPYGASPQSRHVLGEAIDLMIFDINDDGEWDSKDVDIVYSILDKKILVGVGGIGTYKSEGAIWNRQMVHFDCRVDRSRWHR